jgi:hypothetical protein
MAVMNKQLLRSESHGDSNRCTPYRGKSDQHDTYASHVSPRTPNIRFLWAVPICGNLPTAPEKKGSRHNPQHANYLIHGSVPSFSPKPTDEVVGLSQASVSDKLLGLLGP